MSDPGERRFVSAQLLVDLARNTLDPGYAEAARRGRTPKWWDRPAVAVGCALIGLLLVVAWVHAHRTAPEAQRAHDRLVQRVRSAQDDANRLARQLARDEAELNAAQASAAPGVPASLQQARLAAGQLAVRGPGLVVTLKEPPRATSSAGRGGTVPIGQTSILTDRDVRSVVNELWDDGAEAISVNGIRLTPTSAIRFAGEAVLVDFQPISSPYRIEAIGNADQLSVRFAQSEVASRYQTIASADGIGFGFDTSDRLSLPASGPVTPRFARAVK